MSLFSNSVPLLFLLLPPPPPPHLLLLLLLLLQLDRSSDQQEAREQVMRTNELEELQEEAHGAHHRGDYSASISMLERVIEVCNHAPPPKKNFLGSIAPPSPSMSTCLTCRHR